MLTKETIRLLRRVQKHILKEPKRLAMHSWCVTKPKLTVAQKKSGRKDGLYFDDTPNGESRYRPFAKCGTAGCIAGWAVILHDGKQVIAKAGKSSFSFIDSDIEERGRKVLRLSQEEKNRLFYPSGWPERFLYNAKGQGYNLDDGTVRSAKVTARRIEHFIKTDGTDL